MKSMRRIVAAAIAGWGLSGAPLAAENTSIQTFFELVSVGSVQDVETALAHDADLATARDQYGFTAVHALDYIELPAKIALLQRFGADINAQNDQGHSVLHFLIDPALVRDVVDAGGDINLRDKKGRTPIMVQMLEPDALDFLPAFLAANADPNARDAEGRSVLDYADAFQDPRMIAMLVDAGATR